MPLTGVIGEGRPMSRSLVDVISLGPSRVGEVLGSNASLLGAGVRLELDPIKGPW